MTTTTVKRPFFFFLLFSFRPLKTLKKKKKKNIGGNQTDTLEAACVCQGFLLSPGGGGLVVHFSPSFARPFPTELKSEGRNRNKSQQD